MSRLHPEVGEWVLLLWQIVSQEILLHFQGKKKLKLRLKGKINLAFI